MFSAVQATLEDDIEHGLGDQIIERPAISNTGSQIGAADFESRRLNAQPGELRRRRHGRARSVDDDKLRARRDFINSRPRRQRAGGIVTQNREQLGAFVASSEQRQRVGGKTWPTARDLVVASDQAFNASNSGAHHCETILRRRDIAHSVLLPRVIGHH